jgi:hypothetical protein
VFQSVCLRLYKAYGDCACFEANASMYGSVCLDLCKAHAHCDCCEVMHPCFRVCV